MHESPNLYPHDDLLSPRLEARPYQPIYSATAHVMVAFFGSALAFLMFAAITTRRLRRTKSDRPYYALSVLVFLLIATAFWWWVIDNAQVDSLSSLWNHVVESDVRKQWRIISRATSLGFFAVFYVKYRRFLQGAEVYEDEFPNPWRDGLLSLLIGGVAHSATLVLICYLGLRFL